MKAVILEELVEAARRGERAQYDRLFDLWFGAVYRSTLRRVGGDQAQAQELTRRILVGAVRHALTLLAGAPPPAEPSGKSTKGRSRGAAAR